MSGLHWDRIPGDNDDEVAARGILYLLIFQQLGQLLRWSWGYHVLLAPPDKFKHEPEHVASRVEQGRARYRDDAATDEERDQLLDSEEEPASSADTAVHSPVMHPNDLKASQPESDLDSGGQTPVTQNDYTSSVSSLTPSNPKALSSTLPTPANGNVLRHNSSCGHITTFPAVGSSVAASEREGQGTMKCWALRVRSLLSRSYRGLSSRVARIVTAAFRKLPTSLQTFLTRAAAAIQRFFRGLWAFMNPPLWAMLAAIIVASIPSLQRLFFTPGTFIQNSVTSAIRQSGGVAVPLILVVLGANLARNTLPNDSQRVEDQALNKKLLIASIVSRMLLPIIVMAPLLALAAKYVPVSILDDPIFVVVCFLLTGAPSALQLAQICQINGVYESVMSSLLFQSYVIWYVVIYTGRMSRD